MYSRLKGSSCKRKECFIVIKILKGTVQKDRQHTLRKLKASYIIVNNFNTKQR